MPYGTSHTPGPDQTEKQLTLSLDPPTQPTYRTVFSKLSPDSSLRPFPPGSIQWASSEVLFEERIR